MERYVTADGERFATVEDEPSTCLLAETLAADDVSLRDDQATEISLAAIEWGARLGAELRSGIALLIDYGHPADELYGPRRMAGTLMTYAKHQAGNDPYVRIGAQDITAHVDLTAIDRAARSGGLEPVGATTQARFLASLGLTELLSGLGRRPTRRPTTTCSPVRRSHGCSILDTWRTSPSARGVCGVDPDPPLRGFGDPGSRPGHQEQAVEVRRVRERLDAFPVQLPPPPASIDARVIGQPDRLPEWITSARGRLDPASGGTLPAVPGCRRRGAHRAHRASCRRPPARRADQPAGRRGGPRRRVPHRDGAP